VWTDSIQELSIPAIFRNGTRGEFSMQRRSKIIFLSLLCCSVMFWGFLGLVFAVEITIVGEVNYLYQIIADGQFYEVANTAMGDDLVINHIAKKSRGHRNGRRKRGGENNYRDII
jgi:hypothetical protein